MKKLLTLALVLIMGLVIFSGCDNMDNPVEPNNSNNNSSLTISSLSNSIENTDCENWTWEELDLWAKEVSKDIDCIEFNEMVRNNDCFRKWFYQWIEIEEEAGNFIVIETKEFFADETVNGPNCGVVDYGNDNCFNGDFNKLDSWAKKIIERGNEKEIMEKLNHNPCMRKWLYELGLLDFSYEKLRELVRFVVKKRKYIGDCPVTQCTSGNCLIKIRIAYFDDGTYSADGEVICQ